jgi:hypothetical protein
VNVLDADVYGEAADEDHIRAVPLSHLSIEVGHFYLDRIRDDEELMRSQFRRVAPWVTAAAATVDAGGRSRVSTCFLIDDYFRSEPGPAQIMPKLLAAAAECGVSIDYLAREAGCHVAGDVPLAELTAARLLPEPAPGTNGSRPPTATSGWLCNGERSPGSDSGQAMRAQQWQPPQEFGKRHHSIFVDVELWKDAGQQVNGRTTAQRSWACPFLASVWQLLRLGMLRYHGAAVVEPDPWPPGAEWPEHWDDLPAIIRLNPHAAPFAAYRSLSILPHWYLPIENAVRMILGHLSLDEAVTEQFVERGAREGLRVSRSVIDRISHIFLEGP